MSQIDKQHKDTDGFLHIFYATENSFGWSLITPLIEKKIAVEPKKKLRDYDFGGSWMPQIFAR
jgi:hypothetical protein